MLLICIKWTLTYNAPGDTSATLNFFKMLMQYAYFMCVLIHAYNTNFKESQPLLLIEAVPRSLTLC